MKSFKHWTVLAFKKEGDGSCVSKRKKPTLPFISIKVSNSVFTTL